MIPNFMVILTQAKGSFCFFIVLVYFLFLNCMRIYPVSIQYQRYLCIWFHHDLFYSVLPFFSLVMHVLSSLYGNCTNKSDLCQQRWTWNHALLFFFITALATQCCILRAIPRRSTVILLHSIAKVTHVSIFINKQRQNDVDAMATGWVISSSQFLVI